MKKLKLIPTTFVLIILCLIVFSPFRKYERKQPKMLKVSTTIQANPCEVFDYLGNSNHASDWSSYVSHITPLQGEDGQVGSLRRCFKDQAELKEQWDEETVLVENCQKRRLTIFNLQKFSIKANGLMTEQIYESLKNGQCKLSFTLFFMPQQNTWWQQLKMYVLSYYIEGIFKKNLRNIKTLVEAT